MSYLLERLYNKEKLQAGDTVKYILDDGDLLVRDKEYVIKHCDVSVDGYGILSLEGIDGNWSGQRFEFVR